MNSSYDITKVFLFSELNEKELNLIRNFSSFHTYVKGEIIFFDTEPYQGFYGIIEGMVKIYKISKEGREHIIHLEHSGSTFAEIPMFERYFENKVSECFYPANAMAIEDETIVVKIPYKPFLELLELNSKISMKLLCSFSKRLKFLNSHIESLTLDDVTKRLSKYLINKINKNLNGNVNEIKIELNISKYDLASHLGTIIETLSRAFRKLQSEELIEVSGKIITVKNLPALKKSIV